MISETVTKTADPMIEELRRRLATELRPLGDICELRPACAVKNVDDDPLKLVVCGGGGRPIGVVKCSPVVRPDMVAMEMQLARRARERLGEDVGRVILEPLLEGELAGRSFTVLPYCHPLSEKRIVRGLERRWYGPAVLDWLYRATVRTARVASDAEVATMFGAPLQSLAGDSRVPERWRAEAVRADGQLDRGEWHPKVVLAHNDFWMGNILRMPGGGWRRSEFALIDWGGAVLDGHAMYDLVAMGGSLGLSAARLRREVARHCAALEASLESAPCYLLASLGYLGQHLNHFPAERYVRTVEQCGGRLLAAVKGKE